jgi:PAS domain S-box-containing protein
MWPVLDNPAAANTLVGSATFTLGLCVAFGESLVWVMRRLGAAHVALAGERVELANKRSEARFQALTRNVTEIVAILDDDGTVKYCSDTIEGLLNISVDELCRQPVRERIHPDDLPEVRRLLTTSLSDGQHSHHTEFRLRHADGSWRHIEATCRDMRNEPQIGGLVLNARDVSDRKALERELTHRAFHDSLTELPNRELLVDRLDHALARSGRGGGRTAVLFIDLDGFKAVNDTLGHQVGDTLLIDVAQRLGVSVRAGDTVARMDLQEALDQDQFRVWYQPIVDLQTGRVGGVEALVRWQHPTRGLVPPDRFITAAEDSGLIVPIGRWVLRQACQQAVEWRKDQPDLTVSVNLSARQFRYSSLVPDVVAALRDSGLPAAALKLEVTETVAMEAGIASITTFQTLAYLKRFRVDTLKVDRTFIDGIERDEHDTAIVRSVVSLARSLGLTVTAEGIETADQLDAVRTLDCDEGQGFLFLRPKPSEEITHFMQQQQKQQPGRGLLAA